MFFVDSKAKLYNILCWVLRDKAKKMGIPSTRKMSKSELIDNIIASQKSTRRFNLLNVLFGLIALIVILSIFHWKTVMRLRDGILSKRVYFDTLDYVDSPGPTYAILIGSSIVKSNVVLPDDVCPLQIDIDYEDVSLHENEPHRYTMFEKSIQMMYELLLKLDVVIEERFTLISPSISYKRTILKKIDKTFKLLNGRNFIIAFSGHGGVNGGFYLTEGQRIFYDDIVKLWKSNYSPGKTLTIILESCHSGLWIEKNSLDIDVKGVYIQTCGTGSQICYGARFWNGGFMQYWIDFQDKQKMSLVWMSEKQDPNSNSRYDGIKISPNKYILFV